MIEHIASMKQVALKKHSVLSSNIPMRVFVKNRAFEADSIMVTHTHDLILRFNRDVQTRNSKSAVVCLLKAKTIAKIDHLRQRGLRKAPDTQNVLLGRKQAGIMHPIFHDSIAGRVRVEISPESVISVLAIA